MASTSTSACSSDEAPRLNRAFTIVQTEGRPMVIAKAATSLDSRIAARRACARS